MSNTFITSDTHFGHANICTFLNRDGSKLRPWNDVAEMDEALVANWNAVVGVHDKVYHLGDVVINRKSLSIMDRLNGKKRLIRGNHDIFKTADYLKYFDEIYGVRVLSDMILSHIPLYHESITTRFNCNVHGHLHGNTIENGAYLCVSVEQTNYRPLSLEEIRTRITEKRNRLNEHNCHIDSPNVPIVPYAI